MPPTTENQEPPRPPKVVITQPSSNDLLPRVSIESTDSYRNQAPNTRGSKSQCCAIL